MDPEVTELPDDTTTADEDFAAGFADAPTTPTETPGTEQEPAAAAEPEPPVEYHQITKADYEALMAAAAEVAALKDSQQRSFGTAFGKIGGIERQLKGADVEIDQAEIDALRADGFESHARGLEKIRDLKVVRTGGVLTDEDKTAIRTDLKRELQIEQVADEHPDWEQVAAHPEFAAWKATQSAADQARLANDWNPRFISRKLTEFKAAQAKAATPAPAPAPDTTRKSRMTAAVTPRGTGASAPASDPESEFMAGFNSP